MTSNPLHTTTLEALEACMFDLHRAASEAVFEHWEQIKAREKLSTSWEDRSNLSVAAHRKGNHIQAKWIGIKWYGKGGARRQLKVNIARSRVDLSYSMAKLSPWAREWEVPIVEETERKLTSIRKQAYHLVRAIMAVKNAAQIEKNQPIEEAESESADDE